MTDTPSGTGANGGKSPQPIPVVKKTSGARAGTRMRGLRGGYVSMGEEIDYARKREQALHLKVTKRWSHAAIAAELGVTRQCVDTWLKKELETLAQSTQQHTRKLRAMENRTLDLMQGEIWDKAMSGNLMAVQTMLRLLERRAKLNGLDKDVRAVLPPWLNMQTFNTLKVEASDEELRALASGRTPDRLAGLLGGPAASGEDAEAGEIIDA